MNSGNPLPDELLQRKKTLPPIHFTEKTSTRLYREGGEEAVGLVIEAKDINENLLKTKLTICFTTCFFVENKSCKAGRN